MSGVIVVTGQSGVGKDFLVEKALQETEPIAHANWGDLFSEATGQNKDNHTYSPGDPRTEAIQAVVLSRVVEMRPVIVTSHPVKVYSDFEHVNWDLEKKLSPSDYIFVQAPADTIVKRLNDRNEQGRRQSMVPSEEEVRHAQSRKLELMYDLAVYVGARLSIIENCDETVETAVSSMVGVINDALHFESNKG